MIAVNEVDMEVIDYLLSVGVDTNKFTTQVTAITFRLIFHCFNNDLFQHRVRIPLYIVHVSLEIFSWPRS
jgi:hypothetical protein